VSKKRQFRRDNAPVKDEVAPVERDLFVTPSGIEVPLRPISLQDLFEAQRNIEAHFREQGEPIDVPTYTVTTVAGDVEEHPLTEKNLDAKNKDGSPNEEETERRHEEWRAHLAAVERMEGEKARVGREIILEGIALEMPADDEWVERQRRRYIQVPDDPEERRIHYLDRIVFRSVTSINECIVQILELSAQGMVTEEELAAVGDLFRRSLQPQPRQPGEQVGAAEGAGDQGRQVAQQHGDDAGSDDERVGVASE